jgi:hypothetical protein
MSPLIIRLFFRLFSKQISFGIFEGPQPTGPMYFVLCRLYPLLFPGYHGSVWILPEHGSLKNDLSLPRGSKLVFVKRIMGQTNEQQRHFKRVANQ